METVRRIDRCAFPRRTFSHALSIKRLRTPPGNPVHKWASTHCGQAGQWHEPSHISGSRHPSRLPKPGAENHRFGLPGRAAPHRHRNHLGKCRHQPAAGIHKTRRQARARRCPGRHQARPPRPQRHGCRRTTTPVHIYCSQLFESSKTNHQAFTGSGNTVNVILQQSAEGRVAFIGMRL